MLCIPLYIRRVFREQLLLFCVCSMGSQPTRVLNHQSVCLSVCLCLSLSVCLSDSLSLCLFLSLLCLSLCLSLSVCLPLSLSLSSKKLQIVTHRGCIFQFAIQFPFHIFFNQTHHTPLQCFFFGGGGVGGEGVIHITTPSFHFAPSPWRERACL